MESIEQCLHWFLQCLSSQPTTTENILIFYCSNDREPIALLKPLTVRFLLVVLIAFDISSHLKTCRFDHVIFCSPVAKVPSPANNGSTGHGNRNIFAAMLKNWKSTLVDQWRATQNLSEEMSRLSLHAEAYEKLLLDVRGDDSKPSIHCFPSVAQALTWIDQRKSSKPSVLVTGSLYLLGALLKLFQENPDDNILT